MTEKPLYQDEKLKVDYFQNSPEDHLLYIKQKDGKEINFVVQRGILRELARTSRGGIERKVANFNDIILFVIKEEGIGIDGLHVALCQAYAEEENRVREFIKTQETK